MPTNWFDVDTEGLRKLIRAKGKHFIIFELVQNCWDTRANRVDVTLESTGYGEATLTVEDDNPEGFKNLSHAFTLFAESEKKGDPTKRGRFNLGEKLVLAMCESALIESTTGAVEFTKEGRKLLRRRREAGSRFTAVLKMSRMDIRDADAAINELLVPGGIVTTYNGKVVESSAPVTLFTTVLPTIISDDEGVLRPSARKTLIEIHAVKAGEEAYIYEMGIPVVATGDRFHVNVMQKVPVNFDRDNVPPSYAQKLRASVLNATHHLLSAEDATAPWARDALAHADVADTAVKAMMDLRFGTQRVSYDPSDVEANKIATSLGYTVVTGNTMSGDEWDNVRRAGAILPAGKVTPSPKVLFSPDGEPLDVVDPSAYSPGMKAIVELTEKLGRLCLDAPVESRVVRLKQNFRAFFQKGIGGAPSVVSWNVQVIGKLEMSGGPSNRMLETIIHELAHYYSADHLAAEYHAGICKVAVKVALAVKRDPGLLSWV